MKKRDLYEVLTNIFVILIVIGATIYWAITQALPSLGWEITLIIIITAIIAAIAGVKYIIDNN